MLPLLMLQGAVEARNRDYANIVRSLNFVSKGWYDLQVQADEENDVRRKVSFLHHQASCTRACLHVATSWPGLTAG